MVSGQHENEMAMRIMVQLSFVRRRRSVSSKSSKQLANLCISAAAARWRFAP